jgi:putative transposase
VAERGIAVSYETVRRRVEPIWADHCSATMQASTEVAFGLHLDEVYLKIDGRMVYRWRAADAEGGVLDVLVQSRRNKHAALNLMRKLLKKYAYAPERLVTDE